ncbi:alkaline phosphatase family protein [Oryzihumus leptocrescens]|uniref:Acid phosphatase n=1 Tax=Oryzihumus leptocrescens TaxID=297536 RepID=A0A542ZGI9_9MICO|nr:alkaline phosphatase family protein [Oryzihumus leptocrescens]TQL59409.1 acid phosphatase [Oryzihumus leptocrescens]
MTVAPRPVRAAATRTAALASLLAACAMPSAAGGVQHTTGVAERPAASAAAAGVPRPAHVVVVVMENHSYGQIIGASDAPFINGLARSGALLTQSYAVAHPSEPNYLALFSGSTQGLGDDSCPHTYTGANFGSRVLASGRRFVGYSEDLPATGFTGCDAGSYARRHNPWVNFTTVPAGANQPFSQWPANPAALPALAFVVPNVANDMHDGSIATGDHWLATHLGSYAAWARTHNSLLVLTWDEDDDNAANHVVTVVVGAGVRPGHYADHVNHYRVLRMLSDLLRVAPVGRAASEPPLTSIWM